ncbi:MAG: phosphoribosylformylglycinamidine synthase subunit PurL [Desulfurellaceae bacterium]|nr:phosphoribosylformylglycinamidine synthase subunit PurL [Desulfurellaceae bacterium]
MKKEIEARGLSEEEYKYLLKILKREPSPLELDIIGAMWSEHCCYKSSKHILKKLPTEGKQVIIGPGENAGAVNIGNGYVAIFKMESHNHPSFIEPYQGAATGVGGILRDIFTMGARPIAMLNSLRFGHPNDKKTKYLIDGVVRGIGDYGNCMGIPTVGGETYFDESYNKNNLVNAFCIGITKRKNIFLGKAKTIGNPVIYVGSKTGCDGIQGAVMASQSFDKKAEEKRPTVQVGDPFTEKLLLEACLETMDKKLVEGMQDMGAAGLTSSSFEMSDRGKRGMKLYLDRVPLREKLNLKEIMLSESQERMLVVAKKGKEKDVMNIFKKWGLDAEVIGEVIKERCIKIYSEGNEICSLPTKVVVEKAPKYKRKTKKPSYLKTTGKFNYNSLPEPKDYNEILLKLFSSPDLCSKKWIYEQYDFSVGTNTILGPGSDCGIIRIKETGEAIAITVDGNMRYTYLNPFIGGINAVCESYRNITCCGGKPLALTDCLNFGNPENKEVMWQFKKAVEGIAQAAKSLNTPAVSGNVSFYNETNKTSIYPTPIIGMVGILEKAEDYIPSFFTNEGEDILILGNLKQEELGGSAYLKWIYNKVEGKPPQPNINTEKKLQKIITKCRDIISCAHDISDGGIAVSLAEMSIKNNIGAHIKFYFSKRKDFLLFSEPQAVIIITTKDKEKIKIAAEKENVNIAEIGKTQGNRLYIENVIDISLKEIEQARKSFFEKLLPD